VLRLLARKTVEVNERDRAPPPVPSTCTTASSAASATAMSDGADNAMALVRLADGDEMHVGLGRLHPVETGR
jgi:hypothetical protein